MTKVYPVKKLHELCTVVFKIEFILMQVKSFIVVNYTCIRRVGSIKLTGVEGIIMLLTVLLE